MANGRSVGDKLSASQWPWPCSGALWLSGVREAAPVRSFWWPLWLRFTYVASVLVILEILRHATARPGASKHTAAAQQPIFHAVR
jgi:hypothetical protein